MKKKTTLFLGFSALIFSFLFFVLMKPNQHRDTSVSLAQNPTPTLEDWHTKYPALRSFIIESDSLSLPPNLAHPGKTIAGDAYFPERGWVIGFKPEVLGGPAYLLHHGDFANISSFATLCPDRYLPEPFFSVGKELTAGVLPVGFGMLVLDEAHIKYAVMFHNPDGQLYPNIKVRVTVWYVPANSATLERVQPLFLDVAGGCHWGDEFSVLPLIPTKKVTGEPYSVVLPARVVAIGAHLHDFAEYLAVKVNNQTVVKFVPQTSGRGEILHLNPVYPAKFMLRPGNYLSIETQYRNRSLKTVDGMAEVILYVATGL